MNLKICTILAISNFSHWKKSIQWRLKEAGQRDDEVIYIESGQQGLAWAEQNPPDLILYYLWTLDLDGYQFCEQARAIPALRDVPIVLVGTMWPDQVEPEAYRCQASGYIPLPLQTQHLVAACKAVATGSSYYPSLDKVLAPSGSPAGEGAKVLIIDDRSELGVMFALMLGRERNDRVLYAPNGLEGLAAVEQHRPDLILLNLMMPDMDGWAVCEQLKAHPELQHIPVLVESARIPEQTYDQVQQAGAEGYLFLPCSPQEMVAARDELLQGGRYFPPLEGG